MTKEICVGTSLNVPQCDNCRGRGVKFPYPSKNSDAKKNEKPLKSTAFRGFTSAETERFELSIQFPVYKLSRLAP
jgi:hypothetical protein